MAAQAITFKGKEIQSGRMLYAGGTAQVEPRIMAWGTGGGFSGSAATDIALFAEATATVPGSELQPSGATDPGPRVYGSSSLVTNTSGLSLPGGAIVANNTYQVQGTMSASGTITITEAGLFDGSTTAAFQEGTGLSGGQYVFEPMGGAGPTQSTMTSSTMSNVATTLPTVANYTAGNNTYIQVGNEVMQVTAGSGSTSLTVSRHVNGTTAGTYTGGGVQVTPGNVAGTTTIAGGSMFAHADFSGDGLNGGDSIQFTWQIQYQ